MGNKRTTQLVIRVSRPTEMESRDRRDRDIWERRAYARDFSEISVTFRKETLKRWGLSRRPPRLSETKRDWRYGAFLLERVPISTLPWTIVRLSRLSALEGARRSLTFIFFLIYQKVKSPCARQKFLHENRDSIHANLIKNPLNFISSCSARETSSSRLYPRSSW